MNTRSNRCLGTALLVTSFLFASPLLAGAHRSPASAEEFDDCEAHFIAYVGASAYQFSPALPGELGGVRLYSYLSYQRAAALNDPGRAFWRLEIEGPVGDVAWPSRPVRVVRGIGRIDESGTALAEWTWDGRDEDGRLVEPGRYRYTFRGRFASDLRGLPRIPADGYDGLHLTAPSDEAQETADEIVVDYNLDEATSAVLRLSAATGACAIQQNAPIEPGFPYNYYYGSTHSHSNYSDGGQPTASCSSGASYGSGSYDVAAVYDYAKTSAGVDFWVVNEHNHLINDSVATNNGPVTEAKVRQRYQDGRNAALAATVDGSFVALYGMEWGVSTNTDQGHLTLLETPALLGWETCTTCNGPDAECTPGTNCYFDVFTPKRYGYLTLYQRSVENPSPAGALGIFCHPSTGNFDSFAFNANADEAMQGIAIRSGLAFSTATNCADANVASTDYSARFRAALAAGFHVGPTADHDSHCNNYGNALPTRTVYLATSLTRASIMAAHKARRFFATEDPNAQLVFATSDGHVMGDIFSVGSSVTFRAAAYDPTGEAISTFEVWRGQPGISAPTSAYRTYSGQSTVSFTESATSGTYWYYVRAIQADGHDLWSSPMWVTYGAAACTDSDTPSVAIVAPAEGASVFGNVTVQVAASDTSCGVETVEVSIDGGAFQPAAYNAASGFYELVWAANATKCSGAATIDARATDAASPSHTGAAAPRTVTVVPGDSVAPAVAVVSPAAGSTIACADTVVQVSASDASGVAAVQVQVDTGAWNAATWNAATGYWEYAWASKGATAGPHTVTARATDASCSANLGTSATVSVTVSTSCGTDVSGWRIAQANATGTYTIPAGSRIPDNGYLVIGRSATQAAFEAFWRAGAPLPSNAVYLNSNGLMPVINGDENFTLYDATGSKIDGRTINMPTAAGKTIQRKDPCASSTKSASWSTLAWGSANPGSGAGTGCGKGIVINEFADPVNSGDWVYEFLELHNDR